MKRVHTTLAIATAAAVLIGWRLWSLDPPAGGQRPASGSPVAQHATPAPVPTPTPPNQPHIDVQPVAERGGQTAAAANLLEQRGCWVSEQRFDAETGDYRDVYTCPSGQPAPHVYESWSDDTLASLAYGDHKAAEVLGLRHVVSENVDREALGLSLLYRSVALSGDPAVFHRAIGRRYAYLAVNGEPQRHNLRQLLVFSLIGSRLGGSGFDPAPIEQRLQEIATPAREIAQLHDVADRLLQSMAGLQREVTGNDSIAEVIADA